MRNFLNVLFFDKIYFRILMEGQIEVITLQSDIEGCRRFCLFEVDFIINFLYVFCFFLSFSRVLHVDFQVFGIEIKIKSSHRDDFKCSHFPLGKKKQQTYFILSKTGHKRTRPCKTRQVIFNDKPIIKSEKYPLEMQAKHFFLATRTPSSFSIIRESFQNNDLLRMSGNGRHRVGETG